MTFLNKGGKYRLKWTRERRGGGLLERGRLVSASVVQRMLRRRLKANPSGKVMRIADPGGEGDLGPCFRGVTGNWHEGFENIKVSNLVD